MMNNVQLPKFIRDLHKRGQGIPDRRPIHPQRDWLVGLLLFAVVTGAGTITSVFLFEKYKNIDRQAYTVELAIPEYNDRLAETVLTYFGERQQRYDGLVGNIVPVVPATVATTSTSTPGGQVEGWYESLLPSDFFSEVE